MRIVVLDGYALNPGDLDWKGLEAMGECRIHDRTPPDEVVARALGAEIVLTNKVPIRSGTLAALPTAFQVVFILVGDTVTIEKTDELEKKK